MVILKGSNAHVRPRNIANAANCFPPTTNYYTHSGAGQQ